MTCYYILIIYLPCYFYPVSCKHVFNSSSSLSAHGFSSDRGYLFIEKVKGIKTVFKQTKQSAEITECSSTRSAPPVGAVHGAIKCLPSINSTGASPLSPALCCCPLRFMDGLSWKCVFVCSSWQRTRPSVWAAWWARAVKRPSRPMPSSERSTGSCWSREKWNRPLNPGL